MRIDKIGRRGTLITFEGDDSPMRYPTSVYIINGSKHVFICDTHVGPRTMGIVKEYISKNMKDAENKKLIIFNTHSDYDHIWGNCAFKNETIIAHELCRAELVEKGMMAMKTCAQYMDGEVELTLPNVTFSERMCFEEDGVEFIYAPGHTVDSANCFDKIDNVIFAGDLIEIPIPYTAYHRLDIFIETLNKIKYSKANIVVTGHSGVVNEQIIDENIEYIKDLMENKDMHFTDKSAEYVHGNNLNSLIISKYEELAKKELGSRFDLDKYFSVVEDNVQKDRATLEGALFKFDSFIKD